MSEMISRYEIRILDISALRFSFFNIHLNNPDYGLMELIGTITYHKQDIYEELFEWCIAELIEDIMQTTVIAHYREDIFKCVYGILKPYLVTELSNILNITSILERKFVHNIKIRHVKLMILYDTLFLAILSE